MTVYSIIYIYIYLINYVGELSTESSQVNMFPESENFSGAHDYGYFHILIVLISLLKLNMIGFYPKKKEEFIFQRVDLMVK